MLFNFRNLPLIASIVPTVAITLSYMIAASHGKVPSCIPPLDGCTSISATGRYEPASFLFRAVQMPLGVLLFVIWLICVRWLDALSPISNGLRRTIHWAGLAGGISLIVYVTFLGAQTPFYEFMRRFGIYGYFLGTAICQVSVAVAFAKRAGRDWLSRTLLSLSLLPFGLGILNLVLKATLADPDFTENRIEWIAALCMQAWYAGLWLAMRQSGLEVRVFARTQ